MPDMSAYALPAGMVIRIGTGRGSTLISASGALLAICRRDSMPPSEESMRLRASTEVVWAKVCFSGWVSMIKYWEQKGPILTKTELPYVTKILSHQHGNMVIMHSAGRSAHYPHYIYALYKT